MIELNKQAKKKNKWFDLIGEIGDYVEDLTPVGSRYICNTTDTDNDLLCFIPGNLWKEFEDSYHTYGWKKDGNYEDSDFLSLRKKGSDVNLIATRYLSIYKDFKLAADVCKYLNITDKKQRIAIHEAFIESVSPLIEEPKVLQEEQLNKMLDDWLVVDHQPLVGGAYNVAWENIVGQQQVVAAAPQQKVNKIKVPKPWYQVHLNGHYG